MRTTRTFALPLFLFCLIPALTVAQVYSVTDLGPLSPTGINSWAQVVGNYSNQAFIWTKMDGRRALGILEGGTFSSAAAINDLGIVTGTADGAGTLVSLDPFFPNQECADLTQPFIWTGRNGMQGLGTIGPSPGWSSAFYCYPPVYSTDINEIGQVVGWVGVFSDYGYGFLWTKANAMASLDGPNNGAWPPTFANAINNRNQIVGQSSSFPLWGIGHATSWKKGVGTDLGTLGGGAEVVDFGSSANGVNDFGVVVGWSTIGPLSFGGSSPVHAVRWTTSGSITDLGTLPGDISSAAVKINAFGQVIGSSGNTVDPFDEFPNSPFEVIGRPFIWSERDGMRDLNTLIRGNSGWLLNSATDINVWGQIVGMGTLNGQPHGFLLTPKNPFKF
jgi:probable HAF family extracellular repeat protein